MILVAVISGAHGIRGALKIKTFTETPENILNYNPLKDNKGHPYILKLLRGGTPDRLIVSMEGVDNRNQAEQLRGTKLYIDRAQLPALEEEEFYYADLVGLPVQDIEGHQVGKIQAVNNFGAGDFLEISIDVFNNDLQVDPRGYTIPFTKEAVPQVCFSRDRQQDEESTGSGYVVINRVFLIEPSLTKWHEDKDKPKERKQNRAARNPDEVKESDPE